MERPLFLFVYHWFSQTDPLSMYVFAESRKEADGFVKKEVKKIGRDMKGKYGCDKVYTYPVKKGFLKEVSEKS